MSAPQFADAGGGGRAAAASDGESATSRLGSLLTGKKKAPAKSAFDKTYTEMQADFTGRGMVSPRIGYPAPKPEPTGIKKWTSAVAGSSMVTSIKSAFKPKESKPVPLGAPKKKSFFAKKSDTPHPDDAVSVFSKSTVGPDIYVVMARRHETAGETSLAIEDYENALDAEKHHLRATTGLARLLDAEGKHDEARELFIDATKHHPQSASAWNDLGTFHAQHDSRREAIRAMNQAVALDPRRDLYRNNLAVFLVEAGQPRQALAHLQAVHPPAVAHYSLGHLLQQRGRSVEALEYFRTAHQQDPGFAEARTAVEMLAGRTGPPAHRHSPPPPQSVVRRPVARPNDERVTIQHRVQHDHHAHDNVSATTPKAVPNAVVPDDLISEDVIPEDTMSDAYRLSPGDRVVLRDDPAWPDESQLDAPAINAEVALDDVSGYDVGTDESVEEDSYVQYDSEAPDEPETLYNAESTHESDSQVVARLRIGTTCTTSARRGYARRTPPRGDAGSRRATIRTG